MKTFNIFNRFLPVLAILVAFTFNANAQRSKKESGEKDKNHSEYRSKDRNERFANNRGWDRNKNEKSDKYSRKDDNYQSEYHPKYSKNWNRRDNNYYEHRQYGRVYKRFDREPSVYSCGRDNYYYYGNHFYNYRRGIGYCAVDAPRNVYFRHLPADCERVYVNGQVFFRNGDFFFQLSPRGYSIVSSPVEVRISARF
jgi:hypothetical protein